MYKLSIRNHLLIYADERKFLLNSLIIFRPCLHHSSTGVLLCHAHITLRLSPCRFTLCKQLVIRNKFIFNSLLQYKKYIYKIFVYIINIEITNINVAIININVAIININIVIINISIVVIHINIVIIDYNTM